MRRIMRPMARGSFSSTLANSPSIADIAASIRASSAGDSPAPASLPPGPPSSPARPPALSERPVTANGDRIFTRR